MNESLPHLSALLVDLPEQFSSTAQVDKTLLLDGDFSIYQATAKCSKLTTAVNRFYTSVLTQMYLVGVKNAYVYITPTNCAKCNRYHYPTIKRYQSERAKAKVFIPLKEPLKQYLINNPFEYSDRGIEIVFSDWFEADDLMIMDAYTLKDNSLISSGDKDLVLTPYPWYDNSTGKISVLDDPYGYITYTSGISQPCKGRGLKFFFAQMLMGDTADSVKGIQSVDGALCGAATAFKLLKDVNSVPDALNLIISLYAKINQNVLAEAEMLWLRRSESDSAYRFFKEHITNDAYAVWIDQLHEYHQEILSRINLEGTL